LERGSPADQLASGVGPKALLGGRPARLFHELAGVLGGAESLSSNGHLASDRQRVSPPGDGEVGRAGDPLRGAIAKVFLCARERARRIVGGGCVVIGASLDLLSILSHLIGAD